ncbi:DUF3124 domain-containing protein [Paramagnetospirillum kuznetsovii]|nr:DUF3124 domain-containing protein [Paramagnetospirillum kuznetsovii]
MPTAALLLSTLLAQPLAAQEALPLTKGQSVYVPVYSQISHGNLDGRGQPMELLLSGMLSIRNTDPTTPITITAARYYGTDGKVLREFITKPTVLGAMASTDYFVEHKDKSGGTGANFVVEWHADKPVNPPLIETVNAYFFGTQSVAFTSPGRPILVPK